jgi:transposase
VQVEHGAAQADRPAPLPGWSLARVVEALQALRSIRLVTAATIMVEAGDLGRFKTMWQFMGYLGVVPGEPSTGTAVRRLGITKAGNGRLRRALVESAWTYRHPPRTGAQKHYVLEKLPTSVKDIARKAQTRLCSRCQTPASRGKHLTVAVTAVARELAGFVWAIGREVKPA